MRRRTVGATALATGVLLLALTGCQALVPQPALRFGGTDGSLCVPAPSRGELTYAGDAVGNTTDAGITIEKVALVDARDARAVGAYLAPVVDQTLIGVMPGWPPSDQKSDAFDHKVELPAELRAGETANLVIHLDAGEAATVGAVEITYTQGGRTTTGRNSMELRVRKVC